MSEINPAMTADEWRAMEYAPSGADLIASIDDVGAVDLLQREQSVYLTGKERHVVAALCLHGQPFGFTREDVTFLRMVENAAAPMYGNFLRDLAARIAALLPPA